MGADGVAFGFVEAGEVADLHGHALVFAHGGFVLEEEVPVEGGEGAGGGAGALGGIEAAAGAVVAHALDVFACGDVGFAGHEAAVGVLGHAEGVGEFDPFDGVDVNGEIPLVDLARANAKHESVETGDHESLDVMGVAEAQGLTEGIAKAGHVGVAGPVEGRERLVGTESVEFEVAGHLMPVDAADVFAPTEDLADEAFDAGERSAALFPGVFGGGDDEARVEEFDVHGGAEARVEEPGFGGPHCVLPVAKLGEAMGDEIVQGDLRLFWGDWPVEIGEVAWMIGEASVDYGDHLPGDGVGFEAVRVSVKRRAVFTEALAVFTVEVPLTTDGFAVFDEHGMTLAHLAVEELHAELFAAFGVGGKLRVAAEEMPILADFKREGVGGGGGLDGGFDAPLTGLHDDPFFGFETLGEFGESGFEGFGGAWFCGSGAAFPLASGRGEFAVEDLAALGSEGVAEMPHGREEDGGARLTAPDFGCFMSDLGHADSVLIGIEVIEGGGVGIELIAEDDDEVSHEQVGGR